MAEKQTDLCALLIDDIFEVISMIISVIGLVIVSFITCHSVREFPKLAKLHGTIKNLYYICIITTFLSLFLTLIPSILCVSPSHFYWEIIIMDTILYLVADISLLTVLAILIFRLYYTFNKSVYKLSKCEHCLFIVLCSITISFGIVNMVEMAFVAFVYSGNWNLANHEMGMDLGLVGAFGIFMYIITACYAIGLFVKKLMELATSTQSSTHNLSQTQIIMVNRAIKYVSILSLAVLFSILTVIAWMLGIVLWDSELDNNYDRSNNILAQCMTLITAMCCVVNVLCLYLQFSFSKKYYDKFCKQTLECCWKDRLTLHAKKSIQFRKIERNETDKDDDHVSDDDNDYLRPKTMDTLD